MRTSACEPQRMIVDIRKNMLLWFAGAVGLVAAFAYFMSGVSPTHEYLTDVFIGEYASDEGFQSFEPVSATESFILDKLFVAPTAPELSKLGVEQVRLVAIIKVVEAGKTIRILSVSEEGGIDSVKAVHGFIADGILARLKPRAAYVKARLDNRLSSAEEALKVASNSLAVFSEIVANSKASESQTLEQARNLADQIADVEHSVQGSSSATVTGSGKGTGNDANGSGIRDQLSMYKKLGLAEIPFLRADSARTLVALGQTVTQSRQTIRELTDQIAVFREPAVTEFVSRSVSSKKPRLLGLLLVGLVAAFAAYFAMRAMKGISGGRPGARSAS